MKRETLQELRGFLIKKIWITKRNKKSLKKD